MSNSISARATLCCSKHGYAGVLVRDDFTISMLYNAEKFQVGFGVDKYGINLDLGVFSFYVGWTKDDE